MRTIAVIFILAFLFSCSSRKRIQGPIQLKDFPVVGTTNTQNIGDTLLIKIRSETVEGLSLKKPVKSKLGIHYGTGDYALRIETKRYKMYFPVDRHLVTHINGTSSNGSVGFKIGKESREINGCFYNGSKVQLKEKPLVEKKMVTIINETYFKQELVYNGKNGDIARFLYREYSGSQARPAFTQELTYDLSESPIIGFRDVRIQILGASNTKIKYKLMSGF